MDYFVKLGNVTPEQDATHTVYKLIDEKNGCVSGCCACVSIYNLDDFSQPGNHKDQEGFYVLEGTGWAKIGDQIFHIEPNTSFIVPAGVDHTIKRDPGGIPVKVFCFHSSIR